MNGLAFIYIVFKYRIMFVVRNAFNIENLVYVHFFWGGLKLKSFM